MRCVCCCFASIAVVSSFVCDLCCCLLGEEHEKQAKFKNCEATRRAGLAVPCAFGGGLAPSDLLITIGCVSRVMLVVMVQYTMVDGKLQSFMVSSTVCDIPCKQTCLALYEYRSVRTESASRSWQNRPERTSETPLPLRTDPRVRHRIDTIQYVSSILSILPKGTLELAS